MNRTDRRTGKNSIDMLHGPLYGKILMFAVPLMLTSFIQQLFNAADSAIVGHFAGRDALAAVGGGGPIVGCIIMVFIGISVGANVVIARAVGAGEKHSIQRKISTAVLTAAGIGILLAVVCEILAGVLMTVMNIPDELRHMAGLYLRIYFAGMPFQLIYNTCNAVLRSFGETRKPVLIISIAGAMNVGLNVLFVVGLHWDVAGVATATVIANAFSAFVILGIVIKDYMRGLPADSDIGDAESESTARIRWTFDKTDFKEIFRIGIPAGLQAAVSSLSHLTIQGSINALGPTIMAASTVAINFESFAANLITAFGHAAVTFTSQNAGAGNEARCRKVLRASIVTGCAFTAIYSFAVVVFGKYIAHIFTPDETIIRLAMVRVTCILSFEVLNQIIECFTGAFRGRGYAFTPAIICTIGKCGARVAWVLITFHIWRSFPLLVLSYPASWVVTLAMLIPAYFHIRKKGLGSRGF